MTPQIKTVDQIARQAGVAPDIVRLVLSDLQAKPYATDGPRIFYDEATAARVVGILQHRTSLPPVMQRQNIQ